MISGLQWIRNPKPRIRFHRVEQQRLIHFVQSLPRRRKFVGEKREWAGCGQTQATGRAVGRLRPLGCLAWLVTVWVCGSPVVPKAYYYFAGDCRVMKEQQPRLASERRCLSVPSKKGGNEKDICCIWAIILSHLMSRKIVICNLLLFSDQRSLHFWKSQETCKRRLSDSTTSLQENYLTMLSM